MCLVCPMVDPMVDTLETHTGLGWPKRNLQSHMSHVFGWTNGWTIENSRWAWLAHWKLLHCLCHCPSIQLCRNRHCVLVLLQKCTFLKSWILNSMRPALWCFRSWLRTGNAPWPLHFAFGCNWEYPDNDHNDQNEVIMSTRYRMCSVTLKSINIKQSIKRMTRYSIVNQYQYQKNELKFKV